LRSLVIGVTALLTGVAAAHAGNRSYLPLASQQEGWQALPAAEPDKSARLPLWALATAKALPRTTAAVLELEYLHRVKSPLDPVLRGQIRLAVAHANRCSYTEAQARADLRRAGLSDDAIRSLAESDQLPLAPALARKLTLAAWSVTDAEVAAVAKDLGDKQLVAVVQLTAFGNFQDRLILALGVTSEPDSPLPPVEYRFTKDMKAQPRPEMPTELAKRPVVHDTEWTRFSFSDLKKGLQQQKERPPRVPVPSWEDIKKSLPPEAQKRELRIKWSLVCQGYQPELAQGWGACTRAFRTEAELDRVFEESLFWVVTRTLQCFY
jgi:AhpD family alkylhydroperoxidase